VLAAVMLPFAVFRGLPAAVRETHTGETEPIDPTTRFEHMDVNFTAVLLTGLGLLLAVWAITVLIYPYFSYLEHARAKTSPPPLPAARQGNPMPPEPRIQEDPKRDMRYMRAYEDGLLKQYRWVDRGRGIAAIPIDQAIRILAQKGIPPQTAPAGQTYFDPHEGTRLTGFEGKVEPEPR
jgi:hypothetical protein